MTLDQHIAQMEHDAALAHALAQAEHTYHIARCCGDMGKRIAAATDISLLTYRINQLAQGQTDDNAER
jgi:hypothetical protein